MVQLFSVEMSPVEQEMIRRLKKISEKQKEVDERLVLIQTGQNNQNQRDRQTLKELENLLPLKDVKALESLEKRLEESDEDKSKLVCCIFL